MHLGNTRALFPWRAIRLAVVASLAATLALTVPRPLAAADDARGGACSNRSLRGDYGILISGIAPAGPDGQTEMTVGTALRTYDGDGNFSQVDNVHGQITGGRHVTAARLGDGHRASGWTIVGLRPCGDHTTPLTS
jgi:hypothetical protein